MVIDRENRDRLAETIARYLGEEITAFQFDDEIYGIRNASKDATVQGVADALWYHYDDCTDHKVVLSKVEWDYFQRLILLLKSDAHFVVNRDRRWSATQLVACVSLILFIACIPAIGLGRELYLLAIPFGIVSITLSYFRERRRPKQSPHELALIPLSTTSTLLHVRRRVSNFSKRRYPPHLEPRRIRHPVSRAAILLQRYVVWLFFSPFVLLYQTLPTSEVKYSVVHE